MLYLPNTFFGNYKEQLATPAIHLNLMGWILRPLLLLGLLGLADCLSPRVEFVKANTHFCPRSSNHQATTKCLLDLSILPDAMVDMMVDCMHKGYSHSSIARIAMALIDLPQIIKVCEEKQHSLHSLHMCLLRTQGLCTYYLHTFEALAEYYQEWIDVAPVVLGERMWVGERDPSLSHRLFFFPKYVNSVLSEGSEALKKILIESQRKHHKLASVKTTANELLQIFFNSGPQWSMSGFVSAVKLVGSDALEKAMFKVLKQLESERSLVKALQDMGATSGRFPNPKQQEITLLLVRHKILLVKTPLPETHLPQKPSDLIPLILQRFSRDTGLYHFIEELRKSPAIWENLPKESLQFILRLIQESLHTNEKNSDGWKIINEVSAEAKLPGWEVHLVHVIFDNHVLRPALFQAFIDAFDGRPELLGAWTGTYQRFDTMEAYYAVINAPFERSPYVHLVNDIYMDAKLNFLMATRNEDWPSVELKSIDFPLILQYRRTLPTSTKMLITCKIRVPKLNGADQLKLYAITVFLTTYVPKHEAILFLLHPGKEALLDSIIVDLEEKGPEAIAFDFGKYLEKLGPFSQESLIDLHTLYGFDIEFPIEGNLAGVEESLLNAFKKYFRSISGPLFQDHDIESQKNLALISQLSETIVSQPNTTLFMWSFSQSIHWSRVPSVNDVLKHLVKSCHRPSRLEQTFSKHVMWHMITQKSLPVFLESLSTSEVLSLVNSDDPCWPVDMIFNNPLNLTPEAAKSIAQNVIVSHRLCLVQPKTLDGIIDNPFTSVSLVLHDPENFDEIDHQFLLSERSSLKIFESRRSLNSDSTQDSNQSDGSVTCDTCPICLDDFTAERPARGLIKCKHLFHQECIQHVYAGSRACPICRDRIRSIDEIILQIRDLRISQ